MFGLGYQCFLSRINWYHRLFCIAMISPWPGLLTLVIRWFGNSLPQNITGISFELSFWKPTPAYPSTSSGRTVFTGRMGKQVAKIHWQKPLIIACLVFSQVEAKPPVQEQTFTPYVASSLLYDSNYLRFSDRVDPKSVTGKDDKSELIEQLAAGFDVDWKHSLQQVLVKANVQNNNFQNFSNLNYVGWKNLAQWNWQLQSKLSGEIGYANMQAMGSYVQLNALVSNLYNNTRLFASGGYLFHPRGKIKLGWFRTDNRFTDSSRAISNNTEDNAELNLNYISPTGSMTGVRLLATDGQYPQREYNAGSNLDNAYKRYNYALTWDWRASIKTRVDGWLGYTMQHHAHLSVRDFADVTARLSLNWEFSDKTGLQIIAKREISQAGNEFASFMLAQGVEINPSWRPSEKLEFLLPINYHQQDYLGETGSATNSPRQQDQVANFGFSAKYSPWDNISINALLNYEKRDSNNQFRAYTSQSASINLQAAF